MNILSEKIDNGKVIGSLKVADEVIGTIAGTAALEVDGVVCTPIQTRGKIVEWLNKKNLSKGISVQVEEDMVFIEISILIEHGYKIQNVSENVQEHVKNAVETMIGLKVSQVDVSVDGIINEDCIKF